jgi:hypothetical protein
MDLFVEINNAATINASRFKIGVIGTFVLLIIVVILLRFVMTSLFGKRSAIMYARSKLPLTIPNVTTFHAVAVSWLAPTVVMLVFTGLSGNFVYELENRFPLGSLFVMPIRPEIPQPTIAVDASAVKVVHESREGVLNDADRPKWIDEGDSTKGDIRIIVLSSKLWSTEAEARQELLPRVASIVRTDFNERHKSVFDRTGQWLLSDGLLNQHAVKRRYIEQVEQDFGTFSAPMCRLWTQVEISPMVRTEIYPIWKKAVIGNRVIIIGAVLACLTMLANAVALFAKLRTVPHRSFLYMGAIIATSVLTWFAADLVLVKQLCQ